MFRHVRIEALVVDVNLPGISGLELLDLLRRDPDWNEPPVILMSAIVTEAEVQEAVGRGVAVKFLPKPFDVDVLVKELEVAVSGCEVGR